ncbi:MAG: Arc family DNA-binding protein [Pseudomonadota bacterium]
MSKTSTYPLRLPKSLKDKVAKIAKRDHTSINQFIAIAVAEKISALESAQLFTERANQADLDAFRSLLFRPGGESPRSGDELS